MCSVAHGVCLLFVVGFQGVIGRRFVVVTQSTSLWLRFVAQYLVFENTNYDLDVWLISHDVVARGNTKIVVTVVTIQKIRVSDILSFGSGKGVQK